MSLRTLPALLLCLFACTCRDRGAAAGATAVELERDSSGVPGWWLRGELPPEATAGTPRKGGVLTIRVAVEPSGLNYLHDQHAEGWMARYTLGTVYQTLAELDRTSHPKYELRPLLAESWTESEDHLKLVVKLRKGVRFHDGSPFSARDVKASLDAVLDPTHLTARIRSSYVDLEACQVIDDSTVVVTWKKPYFLANRNFLSGLPIFPAKSLKGDFDRLAVNRAPIGTGPFRFGSWETGRAITFTRNEDYWGPKAWLDGYVVRFIKDHTVATQLWERGEVDLMTQIQPLVWRSLEESRPENRWALEGYYRIYFLENGYSWIGWNEQRPFFADVRVRQALARLFPHQQVAHHIDLDLEPTTTCPYYREGRSCDPTVRLVPHDPREAVSILDKAGWRDTNGDGVLDKDGVPFKFSILVNPYSVRMTKLAPLLQEQLRRVGIEMEIDRAESAVFFERLRKHQFDAAAMAWSSLDVEQDSFQIFHSSQAQGGSNYVSYANPRVDELLERIRVEFDSAKREKLEHELHRTLYEDQVYLFLSSRPVLDAAKRRVKGLRPSLAWYDLRQVWLDDRGAPADAGAR